jgi:hypothetical protein
MTDVNTMTVHKFLLPEIKDITVFSMPLGAKVLTVQEQHGKLAIWALVDLKEKVTEDRVFMIAGTGHFIRELGKLDYVGTVVTMGGDLVWHVFELDKPSRNQPE